MTPLDQFVTRWNAVHIAVPFFETINTPVDLNAMPDQWASALFQGEQREDVTLGSLPWVEESGILFVGLFARSGTGRNLLDLAVGQVRQFFHGWVSPDERLRLSAVVGPADLDPEADGEWWRIALTIPYTYQTRREEPVPDVPDDPSLAEWLLAVAIAGSTVTPAHKRRMNTMILALKETLASDGLPLWNKLTRLWVPAAENDTQAQLDWVATDTAEKMNGTTFTPLIGWTGGSTDGAPMYVKTDYQPDGSDAFQLSGMHMGVWIYNDGQLDQHAGDSIGAGFGPHFIQMEVRKSWGASSIAMLGPWATGHLSTPTPKGHTVCTVSVANGLMMTERNGGEHTGAEGYEGLEYPSSPITFLMFEKVPSTHSVLTHSLFHFGAALTPGDTAAMYVIFKDYMVSVGWVE